MIIGDTSEFAIEFELDQEYGGVWMFGKLCYWIEGQRNGDYDLGTSLRDVLFQLTSIVRDNGNRTHPELYVLDKVELFTRLNGVLYGNGTSSFEAIALEEMWARFEVVPRVDIFDGWKAFLVENNGESRFIFKKLGTAGDRDVCEVIIKQGTFDMVILEAYKQLDQIYEQELAKMS